MVCDFAETVRWWMKHEQYSAEDISRFFFSAASLSPSFSGLNYRAAPQ